MGKKAKKVDYKHCPFCHIHLGLDEKECYACGKTVGEYSPKTGRTKMPIQWRLYIECLITWLAFGFYVWWAFFRD
jgi:hypothetical protein